jgi:hypothetical protein
MYRSITKKDYALLLQLDQRVYPTDNPVTAQTLDQWYEHNPEFGIIFEENDKISGICIIIPLSRVGWDKLTSGKLEEADIHGQDIFRPGIDREIGLHCYHIEKMSQVDNFYEVAYSALGKIISSLDPGCSIIGVSGYAVTLAGINLAYNKLNRRERSFISNEHIVSKNGVIEVLHDPTQRDLEKKLDDGYEYITRCKMLITYPNEVSIIWKYLKNR